MFEVSTIDLIESCYVNFVRDKSFPPIVADSEIIKDMKLLMVKDDLDFTSFLFKYIHYLQGYTIIYNFREVERRMRKFSCTGIGKQSHKFIVNSYFTYTFKTPKTNICCDFSICSDCFFRIRDITQNYMISLGSKLYAQMSDKFLLYKYITQKYCDNVDVAYCIFLWFAKISYCFPLVKDNFLWDIEFK